MVTGYWTQFLTSVQAV